MAEQIQIHERVIKAIIFISKVKSKSLQNFKVFSINLMKRW